MLYCILDALKVNDVFTFLNRNKAVILWYHGVCDEQFKLLKGYDERHIPKTLFRDQLVYLKKKGYQFATMTELMEKIRNNQSVGKHVVLTFDDGFHNVVTNAYPVMKELNAKGCFFLVSGLIGTKELLWTDLIETVVGSCQPGDFIFKFRGEDIIYHLDARPTYHAAMTDIKFKLRTLPDQERKAHLKQFRDKVVGEIPKEFFLTNWDEIRKLDRNILEVGSHTKNHPNCANLSSPQEFEEELLRSQKDIEAKAGYSIKHFCYPAGSFSDETVAYLKKYGYVSATTIIPGFVNGLTDSYKLKRVFVGEDPLLFKMMVSGCYFFLSQLKNGRKASDEYRVSYN